MLKYNAILFDVDGTLIDSAPGILHTLEEVFHTMGVDTTNVNLRRYLGPPLRKSFGEHFSDKAKIEEAAERYRASYHEKGSHECAVFPGVPEMLRRLKEAGLVLCTATSKPTRVVTPILEEQGLAEYFDFIGGASMDESRDTKTAVVRYVLAQPMMQGKRMLMVGDRNDDMRGAADCGLQVLCTAMAAGKSWSRSTRSFWPRTARIWQTRSCTWPSKFESEMVKEHESKYTTGKTLHDPDAEAGGSGLRDLCAGGLADSRNYHGAPQAGKNARGQ